MWILQDDDEIDDIVDRTRRGEYDWRRCGTTWLGDYLRYLDDATGYKGVWTMVVQDGWAFELHNPKDSIGDAWDEIEQGEQRGEYSRPDIAPLLEAIILGGTDFVEMEELKLTDEW